MANASTRPGGDENGSAMKTVTTVIVSRDAQVTGGLLSSDDGEYHTVTVASPDGATSVVLAGAPLDLDRIFRSARQSLE